MLNKKETPYSRVGVSKSILRAHRTTKLLWVRLNPFCGISVLGVVADSGILAQ